MYRSVETVASFELNNEVYEVDEITTRKGDSFYDIFLILPGRNERFDTGARCAGLILEKEEVEKILYKNYWNILLEFFYITEDDDEIKFTKRFFSKKVKNTQVAVNIYKDINKLAEHLPNKYKSMHIINDSVNAILRINNDGTLTKIGDIKVGIIQGE